MAPHHDELDEEIRGHMALSMKERIDAAKIRKPRAWLR
jgi:hypothetical protein